MAASIWWWRSPCDDYRSWRTFCKIKAYCRDNERPELCKSRASCHHLLSPMSQSQSPVHRQVWRRAASYVFYWLLYFLPAIYLFPCSYLQNRLVKIRNLRWETGPVIPDSIKQDTLSVREKEYFMLYNSLLTEYNADIRLDLTADLEVRLSTYYFSSIWADSTTSRFVSLVISRPKIFWLKCAYWKTELVRLWLTVDPSAWTRVPSTFLRGMQKRFLVLLSLCYLCLIRPVLPTFCSCRSDVEQFVREGLVEHVMHDGQC